MQKLKHIFEVKYGEEIACVSVFDKSITKATKNFIAWNIYNMYSKVYLYLSLVELQRERVDELPKFNKKEYTRIAYATCFIFAFFWTKKFFA